MTKAARFEEVLTIIQNIIADMTGNELEDLDPYSDIEEDLGITEIDFKRILNTINSYFDIDLSIHEIEDEVQTLEELCALVQEESELG